MSLQLQYIQDTPEDGKFARGFYVDKNTLSLSFEGVPTEYQFGKSPKDTIEFSIYNLNKELVAHKIVDDNPIYENVDLNYTNYSDDLVTGRVQLFKENYTSINNNVLVSPSRDAGDLSLDKGSYFLSWHRHWGPMGPRAPTLIPKYV